MITDAVIRFFQSIITFIINLIPDAGIVAAGNGIATGSACCALFFVATISDIVNSATVGSQPLISGGMAALANNPFTPLIDWSMLAFAAGCALSILAAFFLVKMLITFWMMVKW